MSQVVKYIPQNLYSGYSLLTISEIIEEQTPPPIIQTTPNIPSNAPFKVSQRKMLRTSKR
jgi:hypothetical protein